MFETNKIIWDIHSIPEKEKKENMDILIELADGYEKAIYSHPRKTISLFERMSQEIITNINIIIVPNEDGIMTQEDLLHIGYLNYYITVSSFISAWYHLAGETKNRDKATNVAMSILTSLGLPYEEVLKEYLITEKTWTALMIEENIVPKKNFFKIFILLFILVIFLWYIFK